jgi:NADPH-dependent ferric siderophore reductase
LLAGDETAAPAIAAILETLTDEHVGDALIEVPSAADRQEIEAPPGVTVTFLSRDGQPRGQRLQAAVASVVPGHRPAGCRVPDVPAVDVDSHLVWETPQPGSNTGVESSARFYAWVAGEAAVVRDLRQTLLRTHGVPREAVAFMGYWRQGRAEG